MARYTYKNSDVTPPFGGHLCGCVCSERASLSPGNNVIFKFSVFWLNIGPCYYFGSTGRWDRLGLPVSLALNPSYKYDDFHAAIPSLLFP